MGSLKNVAMEPLLHVFKQLVHSILYFIILIWYLKDDLGGIIIS